MEFRIKPAKDGAEISIEDRGERDGIRYVEVLARYAEPTIPEPFMPPRT